VGAKGFLDDAIEASEKNTREISFFFLLNKLGENPHLQSLLAFVVGTWWPKNTN